MMREIDQIFISCPFYGKRRISAVLKSKGHEVGIDLARTLMKRMGIEAIYPKPNLSKPHPGHRIYPYLLRGVKVERRNQVWSTDITYLPMRNGFLYLTAVIDWYSRYVLSWKLSNSLDGLFCREVLLKAGLLTYLIQIRDLSIQASNLQKYLRRLEYKLAWMVEVELWIMCL